LNLQGKEIDPAKITEHHEGASQKVVDPEDLPPREQGSRQFSYPTLTDLKRFGNTRNYFFLARLILSPSLGRTVRSATARIAIGR
jgi:hypothetical protein